MRRAGRAGGEARRSQLKDLFMKLIHHSVVFLFLGNVALAAEPNWPQFRGTTAGVSEEKGLPSKWDTKTNVVWNREIPGRGWSSPVVWGNRIFVTSVINEGKSEEPKKGLYFGGDRAKPVDA